MAQVKVGKPGCWPFRLLWLPVLIGFISLAIDSGCTRNFYRKQVDEQVSDVLAAKDREPAWAIEQYHVYPDPRARFADSTSPDHPPMPPDDAASHDLSPNPQKPGKAGVTRVEGEGYLKLMAEWDAANRARMAAEEARLPGGQKKSALNMPVYETLLMTAPKPGEPKPYLITLDQACELGLINAREYQDAREDLYLTALPVTLERFSFAAQFFAAGQVLRQWAGFETPEGRQNNWTSNSNVGFAKFFSTGGLLLVNFANQTVFNLSGIASGRVISQSTLNLDLVQPLLQGAGPAVTLEPLTQAERNLLYQIRNYARFRKEFYVAIAGGGAGGIGIAGGGGSITGSTFQPVGVIASSTFTPSLSGAAFNPGVIPPVPVTGNPGLQVGPGLSGRLLLTTALTAPVSGYLSTLLQAAQMKVDEYNIFKLEEYLKLAKAMAEGGDIAQLQVDQFEQQVLTRRSSLLNDQFQYLQSLDQLKLQLGVPTTLDIELDDTPFRPLNGQFQRYEDLFAEFDAASAEPGLFSRPEQAAKLRAEMRRIFSSSAIVANTRFRRQIESRWRAWEKRSPQGRRNQLSALYAERRKLLDKQGELEDKNQALTPSDQQRLRTLNFEIDLGELETALQEYESQPWREIQDREVRRRRQQSAFRKTADAFVLVLAEARTERVEQLRTTWPDPGRLCVNGVDLLRSDIETAQTVAAQTALANRLDLMNVRAQVVDTWRQIAVFANSLLGALNVQYHMNTTTPPGVNEPLAFSASRTQQELILNWQLPLVRVAERNNYRASLIAYQRARRILQRAEDQVAFDVRGELRQLRQLEENYKIQQRQVELAFMTVENSLDTFRAPPQPGVASSAATAAALTTQLINAQTSLYTAQFTMTTLWITYLNTRLQLYRDMELMPLDSRGVWIDDVAKSQCPGAGPSGNKVGNGQSGCDGPDQGGDSQQPQGCRPCAQEAAKKVG
jgi:outer membrane protein TolC